jgi:predicted O-methyltransferase YrrM
MNIRALATDRMRRFLAMRRLNRLSRRGLPDFVVTPVAGFVSQTYDAATRRAIDAVELERARLIAMGDRPVEILYSPRPGTAGDVATAELRPDHGKVMDFTIGKAAATGKKKRWGAFMHMLARERQCRNFLELGSCVGMSGSYLASAPSRETFRTVEGAPGLARVAQEVLNKVSPGAEVINALFDHALDAILPRTAPIDFLFIDGHHEKIATIHYWQRCLPHLADGALVVFDDISWSQDMRDGWDFLRVQSQFSEAIDLGVIGVCVHSANRATPRQWDMQPIVGTTRIGTPWGWKD